MSAIDPQPDSSGYSRAAMSPRCWRVISLGLILAFLMTPAFAQEALRQSLAGVAAAEAQHQAAATAGYYNLKLGDLSLRFSAGTGVQYNDNIHLSSTHPESDEIITPEIDTSIHYPISMHNSLDIIIGAGYTKYVNNSDLDQFFITPGSGFLYNIFIGDFVINLHDRVSISQNGYANPAVNGNGNNSSLNNTAGLGVTWDLEALVLTAGYDHVNYVNLNSTPGSQDSQSDNLSLSAGLRVRPGLTVGLESGASSVTYSSTTGPYNNNPDTRQWSVGTFTQYKATEYIDGELHLGYSEMYPQNSATNISSSASSGMYFGLSITHRVNQWLDYSFSADRSQSLQSYGQPLTTYNVRWTGNWKLIEKISLSTPVFWQHGNQFYYTSGSSETTYDQYGAGVSMGRQLTQKLSSSLAYQYVQETSDQSNLNYTVNTISLNFNYQF